MMKRIRAFCWILFALPIIAAAPRHIQTADYWAGYAGTKTVSPDDAARALNWVETDAPGARRIAPFGVRTILYSNPNRPQPGQPMFGPDEDEYAHNCSGERVAGEAHYRGQVLTNPHSDSLARLWRTYVARHEINAHFDAVFEDEAAGALYADDVPCRYDFDDWVRGETDLQRKLGSPVIYNGLGDFYNQGPAREIALNATAIGGMMEQCYGKVRPDHRVSGWQWTATQETEIEMARQKKYFFCYGRDYTPAEQAYDSRLYTYASFLLTYDPSTSVLWEYYKTPSTSHVMPETQLVALDPDVRSVARVDSLRTSGGAYARSYRSCFIDGRSIGACVAAVNPDPNSAHDANILGNYRRTLNLQGSGLFDGGSVRIDGQRPPTVLGPLQAVIAFK